jgi:hypothetical protein
VNIFKKILQESMDWIYLAQDRDQCELVVARILTCALFKRRISRVDEQLTSSRGERCSMESVTLESKGIR